MFLDEDSQVCGYEYVGETNVIDVYIRYLRSKIDDVFSVKMIRTVRGVGYVIQSWDESSSGTS
jgi:DNA-binding response OmpR family regulator